MTIGFFPAKIRHALLIDRKVRPSLISVFSVLSKKDMFSFSLKKLKQFFFFAKYHDNETILDNLNSSHISQAAAE